MLAPVKPRIIRAPRGNTLSARTWMTEAPLRMLMNNLDPEVAENPAELVCTAALGAPPAIGIAMTASSKH